MKRLLASLLALAMVLGVCMLSGCGDTTTTTTTAGKTETTTGTQTTETTTGGNSGDTETTTAGGDQPTETTTEGEIVETPWDGTTKLKGYEDVDFRGKEFVIAGYQDCTDGFNSIREVYSEDTDAIAVSARERNQYVELLYNCKIKFNGSDAPQSLVAAEVTSGKHTIDLYAQKYAVGTSATSGSNYNLYSLGMDLTQGWWDQNYVRQNTVTNSAGNDTLYSIVGDFAFSASSLAHALMMNKSLYETEIVGNLGYDIYQLVRDGKWTMDVFAEMVKEAASDVSGNSTIDYSEGDIVGWATTNHATHALHVASGLPLIENVNGKLTVAIKADEAQWVSVIEKACEIWALPEHDTTGYGDGQEALISGKALFYADIIQKLEESTLSSADVAIGLVPYPKYTETQENYAHYVDNHLMTYQVPTSVIEIEELGDFFTVYAAHSTAIVRPAWIDAYSYDYCGDPDSAEMLQIILDTRTYDLGYLVMNGLESDFSNLVSSGKPQNTTKLITKRYDEYMADDGNIALHIAAIDKNKA